MKHWKQVVLTISAVAIFYSLNFSICSAQEVTTSLSTGHDPNIFENYASTADQLYQWNLNLSKDWEHNNFEFGLSYDGSIQSYRDLGARNYYLQGLEMTTALTFGRPDDNEDTPDSSDENDSTTVTRKVAPHLSMADSMAVDSLVNILHGSLSAISQFDKQEFALYDNSKIGGWIAYRHAITAHFSIQPGLGMAYQNYPNFNGITNAENTFSIQFGGWTSSLDWAGMGVTYGIKRYPISTSYTDTVKISSSGHGKGGGGGGIRTYPVDLNTPSVGQVQWSFTVKKNFFTGTTTQLDVDLFAQPSEEARVIPNRLNNVGNKKATGTSLPGLDEKHDDHYAYHGSDIDAQVGQALPFGLQMSLEMEIEQKTFTSPALDLSDSVVADERLDHRFDGTLIISKSFPVLGNATIKPRISYEYIRNSSNAEYYDFDKSMISFGFEFSY